VKLKLRTGMLFLGALLVMALQGCATVKSADARDPWESMNRSVYNFNDAVDAIAVKPVARVYDKVVPKFVQTGVHNFFGNLGDVWSMANSALQLKGQHAAESFMRVSVNTFFGLGGVLDIATEMRLDRHKEDFGQTLGFWGVKPGPYVVLPIFGPSTLRDTVAFPVDYKGDPIRQINDDATRYGLVTLRVTDVRVGLLQAVDTLKEASLDPYTFVRDAYLQKRQNDVYDGNPPSDFDYSDPDAP
jgi:phospholipid-binding lipoprotein MlaA